MKYYLYIIETIKNTLYCGITNDIKSRYETHKKGKGAKYLRAHKPRSIVYIDEFEDKSAALKEEYRIKKTLLRIDKLKLIKENETKTKQLLLNFNIIN